MLDCYLDHSESTNAIPLVSIILRLLWRQKQRVRLLKAIRDIFTIWYTLGHPLSTKKVAFSQMLKM